MEGLTTIVLAIVGVAIVAALVSRNSRTPEVAQSFFSGVGNSLGVALSPVTNARYNINLSYPGSSGGLGGLGAIGGAFGF
jgi:hypothetical protein